VIYRHLQNLKRWCILSGVALCISCSTQAQSPSSSPSVKAAPVNAVVALGRIVPQGEVIKLSVPNAQDSRVNQILVQEGDFVQANQVIAILQGIDRRQADVQDAAAEVRLRRAELLKIQQGEAKQSGITAQRANVDQLTAQLQAEQQQRQAAIASAQATLKDTQRTVARRQALYQKGGISLADLNTAQRDLETAQAEVQERQAALLQTTTTLRASIRQGQAQLAELQEVRPIDIDIARAQLEKAQIAVAQRQADLEDAKVRAPVPGQVLRINTRIGEQVNQAQGIIELARTQQMYAIAEVAETDIARVRKGQLATLTTDYGGFKGTVRGTVEHLGLQIGRKTLQETTATNNGPTVDQEARVVEVRIRIAANDSTKVAGFTNMLVAVKIDISTK
jgi:HlyD family secretion protein